MRESEISGILNGRVEALLARTPFFRLWRGGVVDQATAKKFLLSFDGLVGSFPSLIEAGLSRAQDEGTKEVLALNLHQERGEGDPGRSHHAIYRKYLAAAGAGPLPAKEDGFAVRWREDLASYVAGSPSPRMALGAIAAGEFLAQPVLGPVFSVLRPLFPGADEEYFTKHLDLETEHVREITELLSRQVRDEGDWKEVLEGFERGLRVWEIYFESLAGHLSG